MAVNMAVNMAVITQESPQIVAHVICPRLGEVGSNGLISTPAISDDLLQMWIVPCDDWMDSRLSPFIALSTHLLITPVVAKLCRFHPQFNGLTRRSQLWEFPLQSCYSLEVTVWTYFRDNQFEQLLKFFKEFWKGDNFYFCQDIILFHFLTFIFIKRAKLRIISLYISFKSKFAIFTH